jgi:hypothetical protein
MIKETRIIEVTGTLVIQERAREWCKMAYPDHPNGCPNYGHSEQCPPKVRMVDQVYDLSKKHYFCVVVFDMAAHVQAMAEKHPDWSMRQKRCCLYWQNTVRRSLRTICHDKVMVLPGAYSFTLIPEAMGVNVFRTAYRHGLIIRKSAFPLVHKVGLVAAIQKRSKSHAGHFFQ